MRKSSRGGEDMETAVEALAEEALAVIEQAKNGNGLPHVDTPPSEEGAEAPFQPVESVAESVSRSDPDPVSESVSPDGDMALKAILEALLFVCPDPLSVERCVSVIGQVSKAEVREALALLEHDYRQRGGALQLVQVAGGYRLVTQPQYASWIRRLEKTKAQAKLSRSAVEALAIIAYRQPVVRGELEKIRGVETSGVIRTLLERKLVRIVGRKDEPGRPIMYGTTKQFLEQFGLRDLSELPPLREFKELGEGNQASLLEETGAAADSAESEPGFGESAAVAENIEPALNGHHQGVTEDASSEETMVPAHDNG